MDDMSTDIQTHISDGWAEAAAPTHGGHCPDCPTQTTGPAWELVEHGRITGTLGGQCSGCGQIGMGWITTGAKPLPDDQADHVDFVAGLVAEAAALREQWAATERSEVRDRLARQVRAAISSTADEADITTGSDYEPGIYREDDIWQAWDYDPIDGDVIVVTEHDVTVAA